MPGSGHLRNLPLLQTLDPLCDSEPGRCLTHLNDGVILDFPAFLDVATKQLSNHQPFALIFECSVYPVTIWSPSVCWCLQLICD